VIITRVYKTEFDTSVGRGSCNCPGWTRRAIRECKHTKALAKEAGTPEAPKDDPVTPFDDLQNTGPNPPTVKPMAASAMKEGKTVEDFMNDDWVMEIKFDGHRLMVIVTADEDKQVSAWSRPSNGRPGALRPLPPALVADLKQLPPGVYDGELFVPGGTSSDVTRLDLKDQLRFVAFDAVEILGTDLTELTLTARRGALDVAVKHCPKDGRVSMASQQPVSMGAIKAIWAAKGEGAILKRTDSTYKSGHRTPNWVKVKEIGAAELTIIGYEEGLGGPNSIFKLRHEDGRETQVKVLTNALLAAVSADPDSYVGRRVTISYMGITSKGQWRHPIFDHFVKEA
jgi:ATP-dependent DNA ligase